MKRLTAAAGELNGLLDPHTRLSGNRPSFPSSWFSRACAKLTARTFPRLLSATNAGKLRAPALSPKTFLKNSPATMTSDVAKSALGIAAKYATLARTYRMVTPPTASGAAMVNVRRGSRISLST